METAVEEMEKVWVEWTQSIHTESVKPKSKSNNVAIHTQKKEVENAAVPAVKTEIKDLIVVLHSIVSAPLFQAINKHRTNALSFICKSSSTLPSTVLTRDFHFDRSTHLMYAVACF